MKVHNWLTMNNKGSCRLTKSKPSLNYNEVSMKLTIDIPDSVFQRPLIHANIKIDGEMNYEFDYEVKKKLEEVLAVQPNVHLISMDVVKEEEKRNEG